MAENYIEKQLRNAERYSDTDTIISQESSKQSINYSQIFDKVQQHIIKYKISELTNALSSNNFTALTTIVAKYLMRKFNIADDDITSRIIDDMTGFSFLNKYFAKKDELEEININSWNSIEIRYCDGHKELIDEKFTSPEQAKDILQRILRLNNKHIDENNLYSVSYIGKEIRIACVSYPLVDKEVGIAASIRFIHSSVFSMNELVNVGMLNSEMGSLLNLLINYGVSMCFCGATGSGKTTVANAILMDLPPKTRVLTLEDGTREFDLIRSDEQGKVINNRVHLKTRPSKNEDMNVDLQTLLDLILRFDPDVVAVGEMVSEEAFIAAETARTGHAVLTTIHTKNAYEAYHRMFTLGARKFRFEENLMMKIMVEAFPIIIYTKMYADGVRRVQTILEGRFENNQLIYNELFKFKVIENKTIDNGKVEVVGRFEKVNNISDSLISVLLDNGVESRVLNELLSFEEEVE